MACKNCGSDRQKSFQGELAIHFSGGLESLTKLPILVFPTILICVGCGFAAFSMNDEQLRDLDQGNLGESSPLELH